MVDNDDKVESLHIMLRITSLHRIASKISFYIKYKRFDRIDVSEGININKTSESKECDIC